VVLLDFGARPGANSAWKSAFSSLEGIVFTLIAVGGKVEPQNPEKAAMRVASMAALNIVNASLLREKVLRLEERLILRSFIRLGRSLRWGLGG
jgi:hypothetical protein